MRIASGCAWSSSSASESKKRPAGRENSLAYFSRSDASGSEIPTRVTSERLGKSLSNCEVWPWVRPTIAIRRGGWPVCARPVMEQRNNAARAREWRKRRRCTMDLPKSSVMPYRS